MFEELTRLVEALPFVIEMSSGRRLLVRSRDPIMFKRRGYVVVMDGEGYFDFLPMLHITGLSAQEAAL